MFCQLSRLLTRYCGRRLGAMTYASTSSSKLLKVAVLGASGGIGQPLALMLKQTPLIDELALYDVHYAKGVGLDVSHLDTKCKVCAFNGPAELDDALQDAKVVIFLSGVPRKPGMTRDDLFKTNACIIQKLAEACVRVCPMSLMAVVTNPVNSLVPLVNEVFKAANIQAGARIFGVTSLDVVRANTFVAEILGIEPECVIVPVVGGHSGKTIVPLISQSTPQNEFKEAEIQMLTHAIQEAGTVVVKAKAGTGSATLSIAFATARFTIALIKGLCGRPNVVECAYVKSDCVPDVSYFATPIELGPGGVQRNLGLPKMSEYECALMSEALPELIKDINQGTCFFKSAKKGK